MDFIYSIIGGGFVGAGVVSILFKYLLKTSLQRSIDKYKHDLEIDKQKIQHQMNAETQRLISNLAVESKQKEIMLEAYNVKKVEALENAYTSVTELFSIFFRSSSWDVYIESSANNEERKKWYTLGFKEYGDLLFKGNEKVMDIHLAIHSLSLYIPNSIAETMELAIKTHHKRMTEHSRELEKYESDFFESGTTEFNFFDFKSSVLKSAAETAGKAQQILKYQIQNELGVIELK